MVSSSRSLNGAYNAEDDTEGKGKESFPGIVEVYASANSSADWEMVTSFRNARATNGLIGRELPDSSQFDSKHKVSDLHGTSSLEETVCCPKVQCSSQNPVDAQSSGHTEGNELVRHKLCPPQQRQQRCFLPVRTLVLSIAN